jgi:hypothetical protein
MERSWKVRFIGACRSWQVGTSIGNDPSRPQLSPLGWGRFPYGSKNERGVAALACGRALRFPFFDPHACPREPKTLFYIGAGSPSYRLSGRPSDPHVCKLLVGKFARGSRSAENTVLALVLCEQFRRSPIQNRPCATKLLWARLVICGGYRLHRTPPSAAPLLLCAAAQQVGIVCNETRP